jgi:hypothetical protein
MRWHDIEVAEPVSRRFLPGLLIEVAPAPSFKVVDFPKVRRNNLPIEHGRSKVVISEAARRAKAILREWDGIYISRHKFIKIIGEPAPRGMILLTGRHDSLSVRVGDPILKGVVGPKKPQCQGGNSDPNKSETPTGTFDGVLQEADKKPNRTEDH